MDGPDTWWVDVPVQSVQIVSPAGGVPEESLDPLLRVRQGDSLDPGKVRLDLGTLFHAGEFSAVEAEVEPWVDYDAEGNLVTAVILRYHVHPALRVGRVHTSGVAGLSRRDVLDAANISIGQAFYPDVDGPRAVSRVEGVYRKHGFHEAKAEVHAEAYKRRSILPWRSKREPDERLELTVTIEEGVPRTLDHVSFTGDLPVSVWRIRRDAARAGVKQGKPFTEDGVQAAQYEIRRDLASPRGWPRRNRGGWVEARVVPAVSVEANQGITSTGDLYVTYHIEPGARLEVKVDGVWPGGARKVSRALAIDERLRLTQGFLDEGGDRLEGWMQRRGFLHAVASVDLHEGETLQTLRVTVRRGPRVYLNRPLHVYLWPFRIVPSEPRISFNGNSAIEAEDLRAVMIASSEDVLRNGWVTVPELQAALEDAREYYRAHGYADARLTLADFADVPRRRLLSVWRLPGYAKLAGLFWIEHPHKATVSVTVAEGPLTRLASLSVSGAALALPLFDAERERLEGGPYSPQELDGVARSIVLAHRNAGYLEAEARVVAAKNAQGSIEADIRVDPGPQVLLRSFVVTGLRQTRAEYVRRQVGLVLGEPLTQDQLDGLRRTMYDLGVFRTVTTDLVGDGPQRDLILAVTERPRWSFEVAGGVSTDQGVRGYTRIIRSNLWGSAHRVELFGLAGFAYRSDSITDWLPDLLNPEWRLALTYAAPHFPTRTTELSVDLLLREQVQERTWRMGRSGLGVSIEDHLGPTTLRFGLRTENRRLLEVDVGAILPGEPWEEVVSGSDFKLPTPWREQHSIEALVLHDRRDDPLQPRKGALFSARVDLSPGVPLSPFPNVLSPDWFVKSGGRVAWYVPAGPWTLHFDLEGGHAIVFDHAVLALEDRYRLGGTGSMRGYKRDAIGPRNQVDQIDLAWPDALAPIIDDTVRGSPDRWVSTGGDTHAHATAEILVPLTSLGMQGYEGYALAFYGEVGNVWLLDATATSELSEYARTFDPILRYSFGTGIRISTPVGPLQIDVAANPEAMFAAGARRALLRDEWEEASWRAHLSLGTLF